METEQETTLQRKIRERREAREAAEASAREAHPSFAKDLIPEQQHDRSEEDLEMDRIIKDIDIIDAYRRWCGKMNPDPKGKTESIMISCPVPGHTDKHPSAWLNTDKQTWFCAACDMGGDAHDIAAFHFGVKDYKSGANFHQLRKKMAEDFGYVFTRMPGNVTVVTAPNPEPEVEPETATVTELFDDETSDDDRFNIKLDWRNIVPPDTFLDTYMKATIIDDVPEEYHFWNGLLAIGFACGRDVRLHDGVPVYGNLFICLLGRSGSGKSRAQHHFDQLMYKALPYDEKNPTSKGMKRISSAASGEVLVASFMKPVEDPSNPKKVAYFAPVRGLIEYSELSGLVARAGRQGSTNVQHLQDLFDMKPVVSTLSVTGGTKTAQEPFASAVTTSQPKSLRGLLTQKDAASGFLNRWLFAPGIPKKRVAVGGAMIDVTPAVKPLQEIQGWAASFRPNEFMMWEPDAEEAFTKFHDEVIVKDKFRDEQDMIERIDLYLKKMVLLFAANRMVKNVTVQVVEDVIKCYGYLIAAYGIPASQINLTVAEDIQEKILYQAQRFNEKFKRGISISEISKALKKGRYPREEINKQVKVLTEAGLLEVQSVKAGNLGRPTVRYMYVG